MIDAALELRHSLGLTEQGDGDSGISQITVTTSPQVFQDQFAPEAKLRRPSHVVEAQFSLPFLVAAALVLGRVGISQVAGVEDSRVVAMAARIRGSVRQDAPPGWANLAVRTTDGREAAQETTVPSGAPDRPLSDQQLEAKFRDCAAHASRLVRPETVDQALEMLRGLETAADATELFRLFAPPTE